MPSVAELNSGVCLENSSEALGISRDEKNREWKVVHTDSRGVLKYGCDANGENDDRYWSKRQLYNGVSIVLNEEGIFCRRALKRQKIDPISNPGYHVVFTERTISNLGQWHGSEWSKLAVDASMAREHVIWVGKAIHRLRDYLLTTGDKRYYHSLWISCGRRMGTLTVCLSRVTVSWKAITCWLPDELTDEILSFLDPAEELVCKNFAKFMEEYDCVMDGVIKKIHG